MCSAILNHYCICHKSDRKTRIKFIHKKVSQGCHKIRKSKSKKDTQSLLHSIKVVLSDLKSYSILRNILIFIMLVFTEIFIKIDL